MEWRRVLVPVLVVGLALAWTFFVVRLHVQGLSSPLDRFEEVCLDLRYLASPVRPAPQDVVLVAIDDETVRRAGAFPLPRSVLAAIISAASRQKPKAIAVDFLLLDPGQPDADASLAQALRSAPAVIAAAGLFTADRPGDAVPLGRGVASIPAASSLLWPAKPMADAAEVGLVNLAVGFAGIPRHAPLLFEGPHGLVPSLVLATAALALDRTPRFGAERVSFGDRDIRLDLGSHLVIRFYAPSSVPTVSGAALLEGDAPSLAGRIVVVGATAAGTGDSFRGPFSTVVPGAEVLATAIDNLVAGDGLVRTRLTRWLDAAAAAALALAALALISARRGLAGLVLVVILAGAWALATLLAFQWGYWLSTSLPIASMIPVAACYGAVRLWLERRDATRLAGIEQSLRRFNPRVVSDSLSRQPEFLAEPVVQNAALLFVDLSGYTTLSEANDALRMRDILKSFHTLVDGVVDAHGGFVATFMGDGAMILFGFPQPRSDDATRAIAALNELEARLRQWGEATAPTAPIRARLGGHYGRVVISRLGGETHQQITATGDTVNVASRLLEVAKQNKVSSVITEDIVTAAGPSAALDRHGEAVAVSIRGRRDPVRVRLALSSL